LQDGLPAAAPNVCAAVVGRQPFVQFMAWVSQLIWHVSVEVCSDGGTIGTGLTV
jgi:hypothetical protein